MNIRRVPQVVCAGGPLDGRHVAANGRLFWLESEPEPLRSEPPPIRIQARQGYEMQYRESDGLPYYAFGYERDCE